MINKIRYLNTLLSKHFFVDTEVDNERKPLNGNTVVNNILSSIGCKAAQLGPKSLTTLSVEIKMTIKSKDGYSTMYY